jgi:hypothetical protein
MCLLAVSLSAGASRAAVLRGADYASVLVKLKSKLRLGWVLQKTDVQIRPSTAKGFSC